MNVMPVSELIDKVTEICKSCGVKRLDLFGSFATGTATPASDVDFVVYGCRDILNFAMGSPREVLQQAFANGMMTIGGC